jgi:hypothetical protein
MKPYAEITKPCAEIFLRRDFFSRMDFLRRLRVGDGGGFGEAEAGDEVFAVEAGR